jgi:alpha-L-rhamnosidase
MNRREFLAASTLGSSAFLLPQAVLPQAIGHAADAIGSSSAPSTSEPGLPDLSPAHWIWYPSGRTLPGTFILFRRELHLAAKPRRATGWICADSRYRLEMNGRRIQWGPAPADPRWLEADPLDLTDHLTTGENIFAATVLFYGAGDGTSPLGKPGFLFWLKIEYADGQEETVVTDASWKTMQCLAWAPGHAKRFYLRALQEEFDARRFPYGWSRAGFALDSQWLSAMELDGSPNKPAISTGYNQYLLEISRGPADAELRPRSIALMQEMIVTGARLVESYLLQWSSTPRDYFDFRIPNAFHAEPGDLAAQISAGKWRVELDGTHGMALTFDFPEQVVGWPGFSVDAPEGTVIELLVHEAHAPGGPPLLNTHFDSWTRFICREGRNEFETFDFESLRWLQIHLHGTKGAAIISNLHVRRRVYPWPNQPHLRTNDTDLQRLFNASINTLANCAQETLVDGMARERQQYSGDGGHQLHAVHLACGEHRQVARYLKTWSEGITKGGYFLDCWPAYDRLARIMERQLDLTNWGPILDHGVGFNFDCWSHYRYTGDLEALQEPYPRLLRFAQYLQEQIGSDGLLPVENLGIPSVWIDHNAYQQQRHKQCAFNLYTAAAMQYALAPICRAFGDTSHARAAERFGQSLVRATVDRFWSSERGLFINNLPWLSQEKSPSTCDRSLATSILFDQCPGGRTDAAQNALVRCPQEMGFSYPANACWRLWALAKSGRADVIVKDFRGRWAGMASVRLNNTLQENWHADPDSDDQWSHCGVVPLYLAFHGLMGLRPISPAFRTCELRPQLADLNDIELTAYTAQGPVSMRAQGKLGDREVVFILPSGAQGELVLPEEESVDLIVMDAPAPPGHRRFKLPSGRAVALRLRDV